MWNLDGIVVLLLIGVDFLSLNVFVFEFVDLNVFLFFVGIVGGFVFNVVGMNGRVIWILLVVIVFVFYFVIFVL